MHRDFLVVHLAGHLNIPTLAAVIVITQGLPNTLRKRLKLAVPLFLTTILATCGEYTCHFAHRSRGAGKGAGDYHGVVRARYAGA